MSWLINILSTVAAGASASYTSCLCWFKGTHAAPPFWMRLKSFFDNHLIQRSQLAHFRLAALCALPSPNTKWVHPHFGHFCSGWFLLKGAFFMPHPQQSYENDYYFEACWSTNMLQLKHI